MPTKTAKLDDRFLVTMPVALRQVLLGLAAWLAIPVSSYVSWAADYRSWKQGRPELAALGTLLGAAIVLVAVVELWEPTRAQFARWRNTRAVLPRDVFFVSLGTFCVAALCSRGHGEAFLSWSVAVTSAAAIAARIWPSHPNMMEAPDRGATDWLVPALNPIASEAEDELGRTELISGLEALVAQQLDSGSTLGIEGSWGSGKTSILNCLEERLKARGVAVVHLSAWNYREPDRLVDAYLGELEAAVQSRRVVPRLRRLLAGVAAGLAEVTGDRVGRLLRQLLPAREGSAEIYSALKSELARIGLPVVFLVDDIDRLDTAEAHAVMRTIRLLGELPSFTQVLAYDREHLSDGLFPGDREEARARDYLSRVISAEISVRLPAGEIGVEYMWKAIQALVGRLREAEMEAFRRNFQQLPASLYVAAMRTPREVRRISGRAAWQWARMSRHLNAYDVFVLTIIQYRYPALFREIQSRPAWFAKVEWSVDPWRLRYAEQWKKERQSFYEERLPELVDDEVIARALLDAIFPGQFANDAYHPVPTEEAARKERRVLHPMLIGRYFDLYVPSAVVSEAEIESFHEELVAAEPGERRQAMLEERLRLEARNGRMRSLWEQWDLAFRPRQVVGWPPPDRKERTGDAPWVKDLVMGICRASPVMSPAIAFL